MGAEHAGRWIAALRARGQRADLDEAEAHLQKLARHAGILVEARRHADRVGEVEAEQGLLEALVVGTFSAGVEPELERLEGEVVRPLGIEREEQRLA